MYSYNFVKIFSYWIFAWFLVYFVSLNMSKVSLPNPFFALCMALLVNAIELSYTILNYIHNREKNADYVYNTLGYAFITTVIKVTPIILMIRSKKNRITNNGIISTIALLIIYYIVNSSFYGDDWLELFNKHPEYPAGNPPITRITPALRRYLKV